jgi:hypothetical protein
MMMENMKNNEDTPCLHRHSPVDGEDLAGDVVGPGRRQEYHNARHFLRLAAAFQRDHVQERRPGAIALTVMFRGANSFAADFVSPIRPALEDA